MKLLFVGLEQELSDGLPYSRLPHSRLSSEQDKLQTAEVGY